MFSMRNEMSSTLAGGAIAAGLLKKWKPKGALHFKPTNDASQPVLNALNAKIGS